MGNPNLHTPMPEDEPGHHGESVFARQLVALTDEAFHLWFGVDYLPGVTDLDALVCLEPVGFFAVEVKAFPIAALTEPPRSVRRLFSLRIQRLLGPGGERSERARPRLV